MYIYICMYVCMYAYLYIYIYINRLWLRESGPKSGEAAARPKHSRSPPFEKLGGAPPGSSTFLQSVREPRLWISEGLTQADSWIYGLEFLGPWGISQKSRLRDS